MDGIQISMKYSLNLLPFYYPKIGEQGKENLNKSIKTHTIGIFHKVGLYIHIVDLQL